MKAAIVAQFGQPPVYGDFQDPRAGDDEMLVRVHAAPLSPIVKALAAGRHYTSASGVGFVPGVDGVGTDASGRRVYFLFPKAPFGSMGEVALVSRGMAVPVPDEISDIRAAAVATGGLASWIALTRRAPIESGATVLINGATGAAGRMAVQVARHLGAGRIIAVGRSTDRLRQLAVDQAIVWDDNADEALRSTFDAGVDVILDFLWGSPAARLIAAATAKRAAATGEPRLRYVQLGTVAGDEISLRGDALRSSGLELLGSGIGSVAMTDLLHGAAELLAVTEEAGFDVPVTPLPLAAIGEAWVGPANVRYILLPSASPV